jgi:hypothetical protein
VKERGKERRGRKILQQGFQKCTLNCATQHHTFLPNLHCNKNYYFSDSLSLSSFLTLSLSLSLLTRSPPSLPFLVIRARHVTITIRRLSLATIAISTETLVGVLQCGVLKLPIHGKLVILFQVFFFSLPPFFRFSFRFSFFLFIDLFVFYFL